MAGRNIYGQDRARAPAGWGGVLRGRHAGGSRPAADPPKARARGGLAVGGGGGASRGGVGAGRSPAEGRRAGGDGQRDSSTRELVPDL
ncbi:hypothetical protein GQ55_7G063800 [Panicum hallii var. hallii]|uniref:Uncharacterized protein n=1 Tax=Panicum hallii var. hallii TaxID=1504633 RepID=A0A2T7CSL9_9POAL|nr:hypothetical protein GQ55_7G063800 [Panicum hallii var. hallii]